ncbi:MAG: hypothetical protein G3M78_04565 [Candidatus Nitrohelix vancouverensis]|uniref:Uncharacterized protein n=1 Tax=Candidatus Nitrohelix vancouverensis TaxID=2705534 RepID=A0A7T0C1B1_9BACT|nr:MAG: hypothetical protein G3M78_04565 [Candidatus Nitrohelix vancouverensis]
MGIWLFLSSPANAQESVDAAPPETDPTEEPSIEFLDFLGEWQTEEGDWLDPAELASLPLTDEKESNDESK